MFLSDGAVGLVAGESIPEDYRAIPEDPDDNRLAWELTVEALAEPWPDVRRQRLPDLENIPPGRFLAVILSGVDRSRLNGYDLVRVLKARERMVSHHQAGSMADMVAISYAAPGDAESEPARVEEAAEYAADEIRAALTLTRRAAEFRMTDASILRERLPQVWELFHEGFIDLARARVFAQATAHLDLEAARKIVATLAEDAAHLTTGQLRARIRRLCVDVDPDEAVKRQRRALEERLLCIEPTVDGTANLHLLDIPIDTARAVGRRVNACAISLRKDGDTRSHDNLRADIVCDLLLGCDPTNGGRGLVDIRVDLTTLAGLDDNSAEIPGMGPVIADIARQVADRQHRAEWRVVVTDDDHRIVDIVTTRRRPTKAISRMVNTLQPTCSFPGCRTPAKDCDFDHILPAIENGPTSVCNGGPKCRHDHTLKDHGWKHEVDGTINHWTSPLGHTYLTNGQSP